MTKRAELAPAPIELAEEVAGGPVYTAARTRWVGVPLPRIDGVERVDGSAVYGADLRMSHMLYGKTLRSPHAHARLVSIDTEKARRSPGVVAVATGADISGLCGEAIQDMPFLAREKVRYVGEPVAAVAAITEELAEQALDLIEVEYDVLPAVFDPFEAARPDAPVIHEDLGSYSHAQVTKPVPGTNILSVAEFLAGDVRRGFEESDYVFEDVFHTHATQHAQIEPHFAIAMVSALGRITVWSPTNGPHRHRKELADALGIPLTQIRIIVPYTGGNFGGKSGPRAECIAIALARKTKGRPVRVVFTRDEVFMATRTRHAASFTVKTGVRRDGTLVAREVVGYWDTGAYADRGPSVVRQGTSGAAGPYRVPNVRLVGHCIYTNKHPAAGMRGYGSPQPTWAYDSQMDMIAHRLGMDPLQFRLMNALQEGDTIAATRQITHSVGVTECLTRAAAAIAYGSRSGPLRGKGIACTMKPTKSPSGSSAFVLLNDDGSVNVVSSANEQGQGVKTILAQFTAEELGVPPDRIGVSDCDTDATPYDASSTSSRSTFHLGNAVCAAARDLKAQIAKEAVRMLACDPEDIVVGDGGVMRMGHPETRLSYSDFMKRLYKAGGTLMGRGFFYPAMDVGGGAGVFSGASAFWMYVACAAEVEVNRDTGRVKVVRLAAAPDVGKAVNPLTLAGQIEGGTIHGMSIALFEEIKVQNGRTVNPTFTDYKIATALDCPDVLPIIVESPHRDGPFGAKGMGEPIVSPVAPAIANAIFDAVGVRLTDDRLTPERVFRAIHGLPAE